MNAPHPRDCTTEQLLALLRGTCGEAGDAAALLVEWFIDNQTALVDALSQARADIAGAVGNRGQFLLVSPAQGLTIGYAPDAIVYHPARADWPSLREKWRRINKETY